MDSYTKYIKGALVITPQDIKKKIVLKGTVGFYSTSKRHSNRTIIVYKRNIQQTK